MKEGDLPADDQIVRYVKPSMILEDGTADGSAFCLRTSRPDETGLSVNWLGASEIDFTHFVRSAPDIRRGNLVLMDNGNLRAIWKDQHGARLGLQFLGGRMVQYVIFKRRREEQLISRATGRDSLEGFERQIHAFELHSLLYE